MTCSGCNKTIPLYGSSMLRLTGQSDKHFCESCTALMVIAIDNEIKEIKEGEYALCETR